MTPCARSKFLALAVAFSFAACESSSDGPDTTNPTDNGTDTAGTDVPATSAFLGQLMDFASKTGRKGVDMVVLDNETGEPLAGQSPFKSGDEGIFELTLPAGTMVGFQASGQEDTSAGIPMKFHKTYQFNVPSDSEGKRIYAVNEVTYLTAPATAGIVVDKTKGILAGTVYFTNPASGEEEFVGCATVKAVPYEGGEEAGVVRYFDPRTDLPASLGVATFTTTGKKGTSRYIIGNLPLGKWSLQIQVNGVDFPAYVRPPTAAEPTPPLVSIHTYADSIAISNIYVSDAANPGKNPTPDVATKPECTVDKADPL